MSVDFGRCWFLGYFLGSVVVLQLYINVYVYLSYSKTLSFRPLIKYFGYFTIIALSSITYNKVSARAYM